MLDNENVEKIKNLFGHLKKDNINYIVVTNNVEISLLCQNLIVMNNNEVILKGNTQELYKNDLKTIKKLGIKIPFIVSLSEYLEDYNLINKIYFSKESLVNDLWN